MPGALFSMRKGACRDPACRGGAGSGGSGADGRSEGRRGPGSQYTRLLGLQRVICSLQGEMGYARSHLGEIFARIGAQEEEPYKSWLLELSQGTGAAKKRDLPQDLGGKH